MFFFLTFLHNIIIFLIWCACEGVSLDTCVYCEWKDVQVQYKNFQGLVYLAKQIDFDPLQFTVRLIKFSVFNHCSLHYLNMMFGGLYSTCVCLCVNTRLLVNCSMVLYSGIIHLFHVWRWTMFDSLHSVISCHVFKWAARYETSLHQSFVLVDSMFSVKCHSCYYSWVQKFVCAFSVHYIILKPCWPLELTPNLHKYKH